MVSHAYNSRTLEIEEDRLTTVQDQPQLHSKFTSILDNASLCLKEPPPLNYTVSGFVSGSCFWKAGCWMIFCEDLYLLYNTYSLDYFTERWTVEFHLILHEKLINLLKNNCLILSSKVLLEDGKGFWPIDMFNVISINPPHSANFSE